MIKVLREGVHGNSVHGNSVHGNSYDEFRLAAKRSTNRRKASPRAGYTNYEPICSSATLIQTGGKNILVDPGHIAWGKELVGLLAAEGVKSGDIDYVFLTHHHLDHASNMGSFHGAKIFIGGGYVTHERPSYMVYEDLALFQLPPDFSIVPTPGHTMESMSYLYQENGVRYICAGDAVREDIIRDGTLNGMADPRAAKDSFKKIFSLADVIIPGHGRVIEGALKQELQPLVEHL